MFEMHDLNIVCPKCNNPNYMKLMSGANVGKLNVKCTNCNSYFAFNDLEKGGKMGEVYNKYMTTGNKLHFTDVETGEYVYDTKTGGVGESETYNQPKMTGWICPVCGSGLSPFTRICPCREKWEITC